MSLHILQDLVQGLVVYLQLLYFIDPLLLLEVEELIMVLDDVHTRELQPRSLVGLGAELPWQDEDSSSPLANQDVVGNVPI